MTRCAFVAVAVAVILAAAGCRRGKDASHKIAKEGYQFRAGDEFELLAPEGRYLNLSDCMVPSDIYVPDGAKARSASRRQGVFSMTLESDEPCRSIADKYGEKMKNIGWAEQGRSISETTASFSFARERRTVQVSIASDGVRRFIMIKEKSASEAKR